MSEMNREECYKWTVVLLMKCAEDNKKSFARVVEQFCNLSSHDTVCVLICVMGQTENLPPCLEHPTSADTIWTTLVYKLDQGAKHDQTSHFTLLDEQPQFELQDEQLLTCFFREQVLAICPAQHYLLATWDHGQPFGIFPDRRERPSNTDQVFSNIVKPQDMPLLSIAALTRAIQHGFQGKKIDLLVMANCFQQFFDAGYELSPFVNYLVGYQTQMFFRDSFDYGFIVQMIQHDPQVSPKGLAQAFVQRFAMDRHGDNVTSKNSVALFANDLSWYPSLARLIHEVALILIDALPRYRKKIEAALDKCGPVSPNLPSYCLIDFRTLIHSLYNELPALITAQLFEYIRWVLDRAVIASYIGNQFVKENDFRVVSPTGFSVYFPKTRKDYNTSFRDRFMHKDAIMASTFVKNYRWDDFIIKWITK